MTSLSRSRVPSSTNLLLRILERPALVAAVRELPGAVLGKLIERIGLEDAGELVALATTAQLERVFDDDLWRAARAGGDETFQPARFALWLRVMLEAGEDLLVQRWCELPQDLLALAAPGLARAGRGGEALDPTTRAYFPGPAGAEVDVPRTRDAALAVAADAEHLAALLREADVSVPPPGPRFTALPAVENSEEDS